MIRSAVTAALAALALASCSSTPPLETLPPVPVHSEWPVVTEEPVFTPVPVPVVTVEPFTSEDLYVVGVRSLYDFTGVGDADLIAVGYETCGVLDSGFTLTEVAVVLAMTDGVNPEMSGYILAGAVTFLCPQYSDQLDAFTGEG